MYFSTKNTFKNYSTLKQALHALPYSVKLALTRENYQVQNLRSKLILNTIKNIKKYYIIMENSQEKWYMGGDEAKIYK